MTDSDRGFHPLHIRVTDDELDQIRDQARDAGHETTAAYLRSLLGLAPRWRGRPGIAAKRGGAKKHVARRANAS